MVEHEADVLDAGLDGEGGGLLQCREIGSAPDWTDVHEGPVWVFNHVDVVRCIDSDDDVAITRDCGDYLVVKEAGRLLGWHEDGERVVAGRLMREILIGFVAG